MAHIFYEKTSETRGEIRIIHNNPPSEEVLQSINLPFIVTEIPQVPEVDGKWRVEYVDLTDDTVKYEYVDRPLTTEEQLKKLQYLQKTASQKYDELNKDVSDIETVRSAKIEQLKEQCTQSIYDGFISGEFVGKTFGFNSNDQANFSQMYLTVVSGDNAGALIKWKSKQGIVEMTEEQFRSLILESKDHKMNQQVKYWTLEAQVLAAATIVDIDSIVW